MVRVITQETYDDVVKENMDEFDMSPEDAIKEAIAQFEAQGVDLSNIIKDLNLNTGEEHQVSITVKKLKELSNAAQNNDEPILEQLDILMRECKKDIAHRVRAGKEGIYPALINLLDLKQKSYLNVNNEKDAASIIKVINTLIALMNSQPDLLDRKGVEIIKKNLDEIEDESILIATLKWTAVCCVKHEMNTQMIFGAGIGRNLNNLLNKTNNIELISECLQVIRKLTLDDDLRVEFGKAHEHARELGAELLDTLTRLLENNMKPPLVSDVMCTIACLLVRHELSAVAAERGAAALFTVLADNYDDVTVVHQATKLITTLAGNDDVKRQLVKSGIVPIIVSLLSRFAVSFFRHNISLTFFIPCPFLFISIACVIPD
ncbi:PREDICTED: armadillo repeat-containing protein 6 homolog isoform X1 [Papilio xuthus]|uniref:Armadillo repeat-containing protein 6 homolog isoform X1 n=2 Tax=Papilio xuthus TaxID=66420 RepID=A0AAJ6ZB65_PAPXU|nr:PREDICTED: armadillo repeat-containing protein 6 homolog isoform X1 [Papilio xuthus]